MKSDLDRLMTEREIDALVILPGENEDPYRAYLANGADFSGMVIKVRGSAPVLIANGMEIDEAAKSGLTVYSYEDFGLSELAREYKNDADGRTVAWYTRVFDKFGIQGKVGVYGVADVNFAYRTLTLLADKMGDRIKLVTEPARNTIFDTAYQTKDTDEIAHLRDVARETSAVMRDTRAWIASHRADGDTVVQSNGSPLTIGDVKRYVRGQLLEHGLEDPGSHTIFAQGRDAAVPHSRGESSQALKLGQTIVFDLFPRAESGYFHDMTRTWCIGHASPEIQAIYDTVMAAYRESVAMCKPGLPTRDVQVMVCELFEDSGHPTVLNTPGTSEGYVHSLAHGLGLNVHETPYFPTYGEQYTIQPGNVFTIEPGLYYPDRGYGVRIEDTVYMNDQGAVEILTDCPYDLVIELNG
ncbi:MAG: aminopeptidase P family protein [Anaerolineae bacterium]|nr:aminopeptidase P family protein [Anaerolineae bacterium]